ncbi:MAG: hypothetical protein ACOY3E_10250 [Pseudomonadota bacterium]
MTSPQAPGAGPQDKRGDLASDKAPDKARDDALLVRTREALDEQTASLDYRAQLHLQRAREAAVASLAATRAGTSWWQSHVLWLTAVPAALAIALAVPLLLSVQPKDSDGALAVYDEALQGFDDMSLLAADADLETLADMEFYQWLADNPDVTDA